MASVLLEMRLDTMQAMPCTMEGDLTVSAMDATAARMELEALNRLRSQCNESFEAIIQDATIGRMAQQQAGVWNNRMIALYSRGATALQRRIDELTVAPAAAGNERGFLDNAAQLLQIARRREPKPGRFNGESHLWPAFRDIFLSEVHNRDDLEPVTKLTYLKAACVGKAAVALGLWSHTSENYEGAWASMNARYEDAYKISQGLINMLFDLPSLKVETHDGLSHLVDTLQSVLRQLANINVVTEHWDTWLIALITRRLPIATIDAWEQLRGAQNNPTLATMTQFINARARGRLYHEQNVSQSGAIVAKPLNNKGGSQSPRNNAVARTNDQNNARAPHTERTNKRRRFEQADQAPRKRMKQERPDDRPNQRHGRPKRREDRPASRNNNPFRGAERRANRNQAPTQAPVSCLLCKQDHWIHKCPKFLAIPIRRRNELMDQWGHCRVCFRQHEAGECQWKGCNRCSGNHHLINCPVQDKAINALLAAHRGASTTVKTEETA